jgi:hypothetical protein
MSLIVTCDNSFVTGQAWLSHPLSAARSGIRADHSWVLAAGCDASDRLESKVKRRRGSAQQRVARRRRLRLSAQNGQFPVSRHAAATA